MVTWEEGAQSTKVSTSPLVENLQGLTDIDYARCTYQIESKFVLFSTESGKASRILTIITLPNISSPTLPYW
jgi:hypothetical protein